MNKNIFTMVIILIAGALILSACGPSVQTPMPTATMSFEQLSTSVAQTVIAQITASAPTITNTPTMTDTPAFSPTSSTPVPTNTVPRPTATGCAQMTFVSDVTIPDGTQLPVGQSFTKTWRVKNSGTCVWTTAFRLSYSYGEVMGGQSLALPAAVAIGETVDLSVNLKVPNKTGQLTGVWTLLDDKSQPFGPLMTVVINIGTVSPTPTSTSTGTAPEVATPTFTPTATQ